MKKFIYLLVFISIPLFAKLNVVATIPDYASIAKEIGGDHVEAISLIKATQDPHFADAKPSLIIKMNRADLLILTGLGLESGWLPKLITNSRNSKISVGSDGYLDTSKYVNLIDADKTVDRSMGDVHVGGNPHFYTSPKELFNVAKAIHARLVKLDSENKDCYDKGFKKFKDKYNKKSKEWKAKLKKLDGMAVLEYHESWGYFLRWANFKHVGALEPKPGISPTPKHIMRLFKKVKDKNIRFVIQEVYYPRKLSKIFAKKTKSKLLVLPSMAGGKNINNIWDKFDYIINSLLK